MVQINWKYILIVVILAAIVGGGILVYQYWWLLKEEIKMVEKKPPEVKQPSEVKKSNIYRLTIMKKPISLEFEYTFLRWYLEDLFGLPRESISDIVYDIREGSPHDQESSPLNFSYYILLEGKPVELRPTYENESVIVKVENVDEKLISYISDPDYCEVDSDCVIRTNFCGYGSFNYYHGFHDIWGCPDVVETEFECSKPEPLEECYFQDIDIKLGCLSGVDVEYTGTKCVANKCVAKNRAVRCLTE